MNHSVVLKHAWRTRFIDLSPAYEIFSWLPESIYAANAWPSLSDYNALKLTAPQRSNGLSIEFIDQALLPNHDYETTIYTTGNVKTRSQNWHDFFNMLTWCTWPSIKQTVNKLHVAERQLRNSKVRTPLENWLTLFDENGVILVSSNTVLLQLVQSMSWKELFWQRRTELTQMLRCFVFGHSLHEKLLDPYIGMVGHGILLEVDSEFFNKDISAQVDTLDSTVSNLLDGLAADQGPPTLYPLPVLGLPGWHEQGEYEAFYSNENYFRTGKRCRT